VVISLRLLPKLFASFQHVRDVERDAFTVTRWAETQLHMLRHFFHDLTHYKKRLATKSAAAAGGAPPSDTRPPAEM